MHRLEFGPALGPGDLGGIYDDVAGAALLRRTRKSAAMGAPLRGDQASTILAARRKSQSDDKVSRQLHEFYRAMLREPVPERLVALVDALEAQGR